MVVAQSERDLFPRLVMDDADALAGAIVCPCDLSCEHVLGSLAPLEADQRGGPKTRVPSSHQRFREGVDLISRGWSLRLLLAPHTCDVVKGVADREECRMEALDQSPLLFEHGQGDFALALATSRETVIDFVGRVRCNRTDRKIVDSLERTFGFRKR